MTGRHSPENVPGTETQKLRAVDGHGRYVPMERRETRRTLSGLLTLAFAIVATISITILLLGSC